MTEEDAKGTPLEHKDDHEYVSKEASPPAQTYYERVKSYASNVVENTKSQIKGRYAEYKKVREEEGHARVIKKNPLYDIGIESGDTTRRKSYNREALAQYSREMTTGIKNGYGPALLEKMGTLSKEDIGKMSVREQLALWRDYRDKLDQNIDNTASPRPERAEEGPLSNFGSDFSLFPSASGGSGGSGGLNIPNGGGMNVRIPQGSGMRVGSLGGAMRVGSPGGSGFSIRPLTAKKPKTMDILGQFNQPRGKNPKTMDILSQFNRKPKGKAPTMDILSQFNRKPTGKPKSMDNMLNMSHMFDMKIFGKKKRGGLF